MSNDPFTRRHLFAAARAEGESAAHGVRLRLGLAEPQRFGQGGRARWHVRADLEATTCPGCGEALGMEEPRCMREAREAARDRALKEGWEDALPYHLAAARFPAILKDKSFENFDRRRGSEAARQACERYADSFEVGKTSAGLYIVGHTFGNGKSHLAKAVGERIIRRTLATVLYVTAQDLVELVQEGINNGGSTIVQEAKRSDLLIVDDLGQDAAPTPFARKTVFAVVDHRYRENLPMIVTSNVGDAVLEMQYGGALVSRLYECTAAVRVTASDRRVEKAQVAA